MLNESTAKLLRKSCSILCLLAGATFLQAAEVKDLRRDDLKQYFAAPPAAARPWVYWFPLSGNLTREGITADLEAMARVGIGGLIYMEVDQGAPKGPADFAGPLWRELFAHLCAEARRLGLEISMNNDAGWCGSGGPWITPERSMQKVVWSETTLEGGRPFDGVLAPPKAERGFYRDIAVLAMPAPDDDFRIADINHKAVFDKQRFVPPPPADFAPAPSSSVISRSGIQDLSRRMDQDGRLAWDVPQGKWLVLRFGHTTTGKENYPAPVSGRGLECDKFSREAVAFHYTNLMGRLVAENRALAGQDKTLVAAHIDSWEVGTQNWTPAMRQEFKARRGYDLLPFLPAFTGRVVDGVEVTERFLWDLRQTVSDLIAENYAGEMRRLANRDGLRLSIEAYDRVPADEMAYGGQADEPMGEFWAWPKFRGGEWTRGMASAAHVYGKRILAAEAFTSNNGEKWLGHPGNLKDLADWAFCEGINRFVIHRYAAQPWTNRAPGMAMGPWGLHYERTQTWWEQSRAWHEYLARCQFLLRQGLFVADVLYLQPEGAPRRFEPPADAWLATNLRGGYNFDGCTSEALLTRVSVKDGRLVLPDGMSYRVLVLPPMETATPRLLRKIKELVEAGAAVLAEPKPPQRSPSLADHGAGDVEVAKLAADLWPKLMSGMTAARYLASCGVKPDFAATPNLRYIHRTGGDAEIYYVANPESHGVEAMAAFRVTGKQPEFWWPDTGCTAMASAFEQKEGITKVPLWLEPNGSVFVVFRKSATDLDPVVSVTRDGQSVLRATPPAPKIVIQKARYGVLDDPQRTRDVRGKVQALVEAGTLDFPVKEMAKGDDPAFKVVKTLVVDYRVGDNVMQAAGKDTETIKFNTTAAPPPPVLDMGRHEIWQDGEYVFTTASGRSRTIRVSLPAPLEIVGPWDVGFDPQWGGPEKVVFTALEDWSRRPEDGIRHYSGAAIYRTTFKVPSVATGQRVLLDLGRVEVMAEVTLNGEKLGILWKSPYRVDVTGRLKPGVNQLEVKVVNLWVNRQIGDERLPEDSDRNPNGTLKAWPQWLLDGKSSPTGRHTFTTWRLWKKNDPLIASGLLGPVRLISVGTF